MGDRRRRRYLDTLSALGDSMAAGDIRLAPMSQAHRTALKAACAQDAEIWPIYAVSYDPDHFDAAFDALMARGDALRFCVFAGDRLIGMTCYLGIDEGRGVRCVSDRPWITVAETCECALALLTIGDRERAELLFSWTRQFRTDEDRYWTGTVFPQESRFPADEQSTYTAASVVLAADALSGTSPASALFVDHDAVLPALMDADSLEEHSRD